MLGEGEPRADPARVNTLAELKAEFDLLRCQAGRRAGKRKLSLTDLVTLVRREHGAEVARSTLDNYVSGRTLAPPDVYESLLRAMEVPARDLRVWAQAWDRLDDHARKPLLVSVPAMTEEASEPAEVPGDPGEPPGDDQPRRRRWLLLVAALVGAVVGSAATLLVTHTASPTSVGGAPGVVEADPLPGECVYDMRTPPVVIRDSPGFDAQKIYRITEPAQRVLGACEATHGGGGNSCSAVDTASDRWVKVRIPAAGWVFEPCLRPKLLSPQPTT
jgi:hypothetical protein